MYHSGDLAYRDENGFAYFAGRLGDWMRVDGENLGTAPIERILLRHPDVIEVAVYGIPAPDVGDQVMAALVLADGAAFDLDAFREFLTEQPDLGPKQWPAFVRVAAELPRTETFKVIKRQLAAEGTDCADPVWPSSGNLAKVGYREFPPPPRLRELVECAWVVDGPPEPVRVLPDGCMDLIRMSGRVVVAGPDTAAFVNARGREPFVGLRFRPGALPRLLGIPAAELRNSRVPLTELGIAGTQDRSLVELATALASDDPANETAPWSLPQLHHITDSLETGAAVADVAREVGWSSRTLQRQCTAVFGYGPATLRRILRFRRAVRLLDDGAPSAGAAAAAGYADQPHLHREVRDLTGMSLTTLRQDNGQKRSTDVPSGSVTVA